MSQTQDRPDSLIGRSVLRREDLPVLRGEARYTDDVVVPGAMSLTVLRSPHARARVRSIDTTAARQAPGVVAVCTGADLEPAWAAPMPLLFVPPMVEMKRAPYGPLATDRVNYVGEPAAVVVAETRAQAVDACALIVVA